MMLVTSCVVNELHNEKTCLWGFRPGWKQNGLSCHRRWLARGLQFHLGSGGIIVSHTVYKGKTKALISCTVTM